MGLVDYSDSDSESVQEETEATGRRTAEAPPKPKSQPQRKPGIEKVVNPGNKIRISLSGAAGANGNETSGDVDRDEPPAKRAKTGDRSFFGSLPTPKSNSVVKPNGSAEEPGALLSKKKGTGIKPGINIKTGATPAFSRIPVEEQPDYEEDDSGNADPAAVSTHQSDGIETTELREDSAAEVGPKPAAIPMAFKPLSVSRKQQQKKPLVPPTSNASANAEPKKGHDRDVPRTQSKPKVSLFSTRDEEPAVGNTEGSYGEYKPMLGSDEAEQYGNKTENGDSTLTEDLSQAYAHPVTTPQPAPNDLNAIANNLGLSAAERRQLFGRSGQAANAQVAHINMAHEYQHNRELRENQELMPTHNPVKSIAPGKHSLQQLVNAAQSNRDALEESFARGKANKKDAGSRYGW